MNDEVSEKKTRATIVTDDPIVVPIAMMALDYKGVAAMARWVAEIVPGAIDGPTDTDNVATSMALFPHDGARDDGRLLTDNELLVELAGRKCYNSFGLKAGRKDNKTYIAHTQAGPVPHASIMYHAKMTFFIGGVSRRVSHELIRHYVGADRDEEGSPSQESTRYVEQPGRYIAHPYFLNDDDEIGWFQRDMDRNYADYCAYLERQTAVHAMKHGSPPIGMDRKRIFESASSRLSHSCETSFIWTTNPVALAKLFKERDNDSADLEFRRLARIWKELAVDTWPNLFPTVER